MYLDSCILIKLLVQEPNSARFETFLAGRAISSSELAWAEVCSTLMAKERSGAIAPGDRALAWDSFRQWVATDQLTLHPLTSAAIHRANHVLASCHPKISLRALDAIHTAACDLSQDFPLCTTDRRMREAARMLNIPVFPTEDEA